MDDRLEEHDRKIALWKGRLDECAEWEPEGAHSEADDILCELLEYLGYATIVEKWQKVPKWYA